MKQIIITLFAILATASAQETRAVRFTWDPVDDSRAVGYEIHYGIEPGKYLAVVIVPGQATAEYQMEMPEGMTYFSALKAFALDGQRSEFSNEITFTVSDPDAEPPPDGPLPPPQAPGTFRVVLQSSADMLTWEPIAHADRLSRGREFYRVQINPFFSGK